MAENSKLYGTRGVLNTIGALTPGGTIAYWSVGDDPGFLRVLENMGVAVETMKVRAHVSSGPWHVLYIARTGTHSGRA